MKRNYVFFFGDDVFLETDLFILKKYRNASRHVYIKQRESKIQLLYVNARLFRMQQQDLDKRFYIHIAYEHAASYLTLSGSRCLDDVRIFLVNC